MRPTREGKGQGAALITAVERTNKHKGKGLVFVLETGGAYVATPSTIRRTIPDTRVPLDDLAQLAPLYVGRVLVMYDRYETVVSMERFERDYAVPAPAVDETPLEVAEPAAEVDGFAAPPVPGYVDVPGYKLTMVSQVKETEERVLRLLDTFENNTELGMIDGRWFSIARTDLERGFMALCRAIFQPRRIELPEDRFAAILEAEPVADPVLEEIV